jgi:pantothenate kinase
VREYQEALDSLSSQLSVLKPGQRYILGITGAPGAGKTTFTNWLVREINSRTHGDNPAIGVPMDGFHYTNQKLGEMGLLELKGIPETFDSAGFLALLKSLRHSTNENVYAPLFKRSIEASIANGIVVKPAHSICVVEGNYLLLQDEPWSQCKQFFDQVWFINSTLDVITPRLLQRHIEAGRTEAGAQQKVQSTDLRNARVIEHTKHLADRILDLPRIALSEPPL